MLHWKVAKNMLINRFILFSSFTSAPIAVIVICWMLGVMGTFLLVLFQTVFTIDHLQLPLTK
jgi:hypothetical protein